MGNLVFEHDGNGGGFYTLDGKRIKDGDKIYLEETELTCHIKESSRTESCHNERWISHTDILTLSFYLNGIKCNISPDEFGKRHFVASK